MASGPRRPAAQTASAKQLSPIPVMVTAVRPPLDQSTDAAAEPIAPPMKLLVTKAVLSLLRASAEMAKSRARLRMFDLWMPKTNHASSAVAREDVEVIQFGDAVGQRS